MPALDNPRHERFAQELAKGKSASEAYVAAGYGESRSAASRLSTNVNVQARLAELQERSAKKTEVTLETLTAELDEAREIAIKLGQPSAMVAATREKAVLLGMRVEKRESTHKTDPKAMTDDELALIASAGSAGVVAPPTRKGVTH